MNPCSGEAVSAEGVLVADVRPRTAAARAGLRAGDRILTINGHALRDAIDFQFHAGDERLRLTLERDGARRAVELARRAGRVGVELAPPRPKDIATCANKCVFCFIHQNPKGLRKSLYVKDDDFRLSFLHGNYITLSDLGEADIARIVEQRLSPLYISVHATDAALRHRLLGSPRHSAEILPRVERLAKAGIRMHAQIVLCPDLNDGAHLQRTVFDLARLSPAVTTTAIVPVGLTRHRERLPQLRSLTPPEAATLVATVENWQSSFRLDLGSRFVFLADEIYLLADAPLPAAPAYEGFGIMEDGVGLVRHFEDSWARVATRRRAFPARRHVTVVTGELYGPRLARLVAPLGDDRMRIDVATVPNEFFGRGITVAGLLTGRDIQRAVAQRGDVGDEVLVPAVAVRETDGVFLDDLTPHDLARDLGVRVRVVEPSAPALLRALRGR
jgi:putative radical SAM enzyme (TIGR03279 family)